MNRHEDILFTLNQPGPLKDKLVSIHHSIQAAFPFIARISVALYDIPTHTLKTYMHSSGEDDPLSNYQTDLSQAPSLASLLAEQHPRVINNMLTFEANHKEHSRRIGRQGYAASYTMPMFCDGEFFGFLFFNSYETDVFQEPVLKQLDVYGHIISLLLINEQSIIRTLTAAIKTTARIGHLRDAETGSHMDRMSRYSRLIASELSKTYQLDDTYIEYIFIFSPLHDIGKIGIPDDILLKPGKLDETEMQVMQSHTVKGRQLIDDLLKNFGLHGLSHVEILYNITHYHHEAMNGSGYPSGKRGSEIPLEARIVAVADVFDALTSRRPYKEAWSNDDAFAMLKQLAGEKLDAECVDALCCRRSEVEKIQRQFQEDPYG